jgi:hypothetical protein
VRPTAFAILKMEQAERGTYKWLQGFHGQSPAYFGLQMKEWRELLALRDDGFITIDQAAIDAVDKALGHAQLAAMPLYKLPDVQRLGFLADCDSSSARPATLNAGFVAGQEYPIDCKTAVLHSKAQREKQTLEGPELIDVVIERKAMQIRIGGKGSDGKSSPRARTIWSISFATSTSLTRASS